MGNVYFPILEYSINILWFRNAFKLNDFRPHNYYYGEYLLSGYGETKKMAETDLNPPPEPQNPAQNLGSFQDYLQTQGLSYNTILTYSITAKLFMQEPASQDWINKFLRQHNNTPTRSMLKQYLRFVGLHKDLEVLKYRGRRKSRIQGFLTRDEVEQLAGSVPTTYGVLMLFLFQTGLRISEALSLTRLNLDIPNLKVRGIGKGDKEFEQCITQDLADALGVYIEYHGEDQHLWSMPRNTVLKAFHRYGTKHLGKRVHPHTFRHSIAMFLKKGGMNAEERAVYLNHDLSRMGVTIGVYSPPDREEVHAHWRQIMNNA